MGNSGQPDKLGGKSREWVIQIEVSLSGWLAAGPRSFNQLSGPMVVDINAQ